MRSPLIVVLNHKGALIRTRTHAQYRVVDKNCSNTSAISKSQPNPPLQPKAPTPLSSSSLAPITYMHPISYLYKCHSVTIVCMLAYTYVLSICCCASSFSYRYPPHILTCRKQTPLYGNYLLQHESCSQTREFPLAQSMQKSSYHLLCCWEPVLLLIGKYLAQVSCTRRQCNMGPRPKRLANCTHCFMQHLHSS